MLRRVTGLSLHLMVCQFLDHVGTWLLLLGFGVAVPHLNRAHDLGHVDLLSLYSHLAEGSLLAVNCATTVELLVDQLLARAPEVVLLALVQVLLDVHLDIAAVDKLVGNLKLLSADVVA